MDPYLTTSFFESSTINVILYILLLIVLIIVVWAELRDQMCPGGALGSCCSVMSPDNRLLTHGTKAKDSDTSVAIIEKTVKAAAADINGVKWRISFILAILIAVLLWIFIFQMLPHWVILYLTVLIVFLVIYFYFSFAGFHIKNEVFKIIEGNLKILRNRCPDK